MPLSADEVRENRLRTMLRRTGLSRRGLSAAMGRDPGYVASLLDPQRPARARPTPDDLVRASDATGIPLVEWLAELWGIELDELSGRIRRASTSDARDRDRRTLAEFESFLRSRPGTEEGAERR